MGCLSLDMTIDGALADPVIAAAMRADRVDPRRLEDLLRATARRLDDARRPTPLPFGPPAEARRAVTGYKTRW